jgi:hypothetical protein
MAKHPAHPKDEVWSAPESGTVSDETSGNRPSDRTNDRGPTGAADGKHGIDNVKAGDDPAVAGEER